jgi:hypothetical protein
MVGGARVMDARLASHDAFFISLYTQLLSLTPTDPYPYLDYL